MMMFLWMIASGEMAVGWPDPSDLLSSIRLYFVPQRSFFSLGKKKSNLHTNIAYQSHTYSKRFLA